MGTLCVVGGGISGLAAAYYALRLPTTKRIVVLEASNRLGGWIRTTRHRNGVLYETGPRTVRPAGPQGANTLNLIQELGIADLVKPVLQSSPSANNRMVLVDGTLHKLPANIYSMCRTTPPFLQPLILAIMRDLMAAKKSSIDEPLHNFVTRRLGPEIAEYIVDPLVRGICAGDSRQVSVHFIANYLHTLEQRSGSLTIGLISDLIRNGFQNNLTYDDSMCDLVERSRSEKWSVWGLVGGMETLVENLSRALISSGVEIRTNVKITSLNQDSSSQITAISSAQEKFDCDRLVLAVPSHAASNLLYPFIGDQSEALASIPFVSVAVVNLEYCGRNIQSTEGFGFLVPSHQPEPILGCIYDTCTFSQGNRTILTVMMGGAWFDEIVSHRTNSEVADMAVETVSKVLKLSVKPVRVDVNIMDRCIAQYTVGHRQRVASVRKCFKTKNLSICIVGSSYDGVGLNDSIISAKTYISV